LAASRAIKEQRFTTSALVVLILNAILAKETKLRAKEELIRYLFPTNASQYLAIPISHPHLKFALYLNVLRLSLEDLFYELLKCFAVKSYLMLAKIDCFVYICF
jgi:hypothetical protein